MTGSDKLINAVILWSWHDTPCNSSESKFDCDLNVGNKNIEFRQFFIEVASKELQLSKKPWAVSVLILISTY